MKTNTSLLIALLITIVGYSQNAINYKALIKDNLGNVVANTTIGVQFSILQGVAQTNVYQETHSPTTDINGIIIVNIGEGTTSDDFLAIDWASDDHFLNVQIDIGSGFVDLGITQFMAVPYAINAQTANNVSGLEAIDEGSGIGWRLIGKNMDHYGNIGQNALDLSISNSNSTTLGATGVSSVAVGFNATASGADAIALGLFTTSSGNSSFSTGVNTIASGLISTAMGIGTNASGQYATALGGGTTASGYSSTALGRNSTALGDDSMAICFSTTAEGFASVAMNSNTHALGDNSTAMGLLTDAVGDVSIATGFQSFAEGNYSMALGYRVYTHAYGSTAIGSYNIGGGLPDSWGDTDPLFEIGNGADNFNRSNALTVLKNGTITAPSFDLYEIIDNKALITKEYADANYVDTTFSGDYNDLTNLPTIVNPTGLEALDEGNGIGWRLKGVNPDNYGNIGNYAVDLSFSSVNSETLGATGIASIAMGFRTEAFGTASTAMGGETTATGNFSTAIGIGSSASSFVSTTIGRYNIGGGNPTSWVPADPLFEIGNGTSNSNRGNALTVLKNGNIGIGTSVPNSKLVITGGADASLTNDLGFLILGDINGVNLALDSNEIMARNNGTATDLILQRDGGNVTVGGVLVHSSDRRLKTDIEDLPYGLKEILQLEPKQYYWKNREQDSKSLGLIAQDVQQIINSIVHERDDENKTLSVSYTELIPVLIKAIQEQQKELETLKGELEKYKLLESRIKALEQGVNN